VSEHGHPSLGGFLAAAVGWFLALTLLWSQIAAWTSYPAAALAHVALAKGAPDWVRAVRKTPGTLEVETRIRVVVADAQGNLGRKELVAEADTRIHACGLPLYLALLLAAKSRHFWRRALAGYAILLPAQAFSIAFGILRKVAPAASPDALGVAPWQLSLIVLGGQFGSLLLPTLAPVALWLWFERRFFAAVVVDGWLRRGTGKAL
jgi:hypothetical protein